MTGSKDTCRSCQTDLDADGACPWCDALHGEGIVSGSRAWDRDRRREELGADA